MPIESCASVCVCCYPRKEWKNNFIQHYDKSATEERIRAAALRAQEDDTHTKKFLKCKTENGFLPQARARDIILFD